MRGVLADEERRALTLEATLKLLPHQVKESFPCNGRVPFGECITTEDMAFGPVLMLKGTELPLQALVAFLEEHPEINEPPEQVKAILRSYPGLGKIKGKVATALCYIIYFPHHLKEELRREHEGLREMVESGQASKL